MTGIRQCLPIFVLLLLVTESLAAEPAILRSHPETTDAIYVGQRLKITVDLLTTTTFDSAPSFELPTIPGAVFMKLEDRPVIGNETIDDTTYTVQTHELWFFGLKPRTFEIPAFDVRFESPPAFGKPAIERRVRFPGLNVSTTSPPGMEALGTVVCASDFQVTEEWRPDPPSTAHVGDSFTRSIIMTATDVPGMVFPAIRSEPEHGLKAYAVAPKVSNRIERGVLTGRRVEEVTYVCESPGSFSLPELVIPWWNLDKNQREEIRVPGHQIQVTGPSASASAVVEHRQSGGSSDVAPWTWLLVGLISLLLAWPLYKYAVHMVRSFQTSEAGIYRKLMVECRRGDVRDAARALNRWLNSRSRSVQVATIDSELGSSPVAVGLAQQLESAALTHSSWDGHQLADALASVRHQVRRRPTQLGPLNPAGDS